MSLQPGARVGAYEILSAIVTGSVMQRGDQVSVQAEMIDAASVAQLWGDHFDRRVADMMNVQSDISKAIAENLRMELTSSLWLRNVPG